MQEFLHWAVGAQCSASLLCALHAARKSSRCLTLTAGPRLGAQEKRHAAFQVTDWTRPHRHQVSFCAADCSAVPASAHTTTNT
ncbi:hypothetical protein GDO86_015405 [Hymenochirus boettgeri]|uniref:Uncharacterized protein n=1 Tax=Hymenochirus boettgeri TaxID=247094 RepID=A0A8T2JXQ9_9PIPI|nr:hypothetical protein GDO86_015405 [Hymenochirus boettgeri]